jgi:hypothetical protein
MQFGVGVVASILVSISLVGPALSDAATTDPLAAAVQAQRDTIDASARKARLEAHVRNVEQHLADRTGAVTAALYFAAKDAGVKLMSVEPALRSVNFGRRNSGVWELRIAREIDGPELVVVSDLGQSDETTFAVQDGHDGVLYSLSGYIRDKQFESTGNFAPSCKYEIYLYTLSKEYPCQDFLDGKLDAKVLSDMKTLFAKNLSSHH